MENQTINNCLICNEDIGYEGRHICLKCEEKTKAINTKYRFAVDFPAVKTEQIKNTLFEFIKETPF